MPGWLPMIPFQRLVHAYKSSLGADDAILHARNLIEKLSAIPGTYLNAMPVAVASTKATGNHDAAYLKQEYANEYWIPFWSSDLIQELSASKLDFLGTANLTEVFEQYYPDQFRTLFQAETNRAKREQLKDLTFNQGFRRDLFVRGKCQLLGGENLALLETLTVRRNPLMPIPEEGSPFVFKAATIEIKGDYAAYMNAIKLVEAKPSGITIKQLATAIGRTILETSHMAILLYAGGWVYLTERSIPSVNTSEFAKIIVKLSAMVAQGAGYRFIPCPHIHSSLLFSEFDLTLISMISNMGKEAKPEQIVNELKRHGRVLREKGEVLTDDESQVALVKAELDGLTLRLDKLSAFNIAKII
jgi:hypothetical protein